MTAVINLVVPVFAIMLAGFVAGRFGLLGAASSEALNRFVFYVALPAFFFGTMARVPINEVVHLPFIMAFGGGLMATFGASLLIAAFAFPNRLGALGLHAMAAIFSNTVYMGIPLMILAYGDAGALPAIIASITTGVVIMGLCVAMLEYDFSQDKGVTAMLGHVLLGVVKNPLIASALAGLAFSVAGLDLPLPIERFCDILGAATAPCALFAMGLFMVDGQVTAGAAETLWITLLKLVVHPAITWWLAYEILLMDAFWAKSAVILAALPSGALVFVLAQQYGVFVRRATAAITLSTLLSVITLTILFAYLGVG